MSPTDDPMAAAAKMLPVATFIRRGVNQVSCRACSQERAPVAPAIAAIAHAAHIDRKITPAYRRRGFSAPDHRSGTGPLLVRRSAQGTRGQGDQPAVRPALISPCRHRGAIVRTAAFRQSGSNAPVQWNVSHFRLSREARREINEARRASSSSKAISSRYSRSPAASRPSARSR